MENQASARFQDAFRKQIQGKSSSSRTAQPKHQAPFPESGRQILVAVDFGTTYSAAAWLQTRTSSDPRPMVTIVDGWPEVADTRDKVPTVLQFGNSNGNIRWGFDCDERQDRFQWFKLEQDPKYKGEKLKQALPPNTIEPANDEQVRLVITEYLRHFRAYVEKSIQDSLDLGGGSQNLLLKDIHWEYIITVPALWPESAHNTTKRCAKEAGMTPLQIIAEPEAAGIYALDHMNQELEMNIGDTFVICDAGGGTVDLVSYTVTKLVSSQRKVPSIEVEEAAAGTGGLCGSSFLDKEFFRWLTEHVHDCRQWSRSSTADAMVKWEMETKRNFKGDLNKKYLIPARRIDDDPTLKIKKDNLEVSGSRIKKIFDPVVSQIVELVRGQLDQVKKSGKTVKAVLLAGGFGRNEYLKKRIQAEVGSRVRVKKMKDCTTAIVRGALLRGLDDRKSLTTGRPTIAVASRLARKHYGTRALQKFAPDYHDESQPRLPGGVDGGERIDVMRWFVHKNSRVKDLEPQEFNFYYDQSVTNARDNGRLDTITLPLYTCEHDQAPDYPDPPQSKDRSCKKLVELQANLDKIPQNKLKKERGEDNRWYYKIDFKIVMTCHLANVKFKLVHDGVQYGTVDANWDTR